MDVDVPDLASGAAIEQHCFGISEEIRGLVGFGIDAKALHSHFHQIIGLILVSYRPRAEVAAGALQGALGQNCGDVDAGRRAIEARICAASFSFAGDIGTGSYHSFDRILRISEIVVASEQLR